MALDIQTLEMVPSYIPYERPPQSFTLWSAIPRGLQSFIVGNRTLDAKAINDDALLSLTATLPPNFGYVMNDMNLGIAQDRAIDWNPVVNLNLQNYYRAPEALSFALSSNWVSQFLINDLLDTQRSLATSSASKPWPTFPIIGAEGTSGALIVITASNPSNTASIAGTVDGYISFWQFDLEQIRKYPINSPQPVHLR